MMVAVFATMALALVLSWVGYRRPALACIVACLFLSIWLFLFEVYSPDYGFRMPWLRAELGPTAAMEA